MALFIRLVFFRITGCNLIQMSLINGSNERHWFPKRFIKVMNSKHTDHWPLFLEAAD